MTDVVTKPSDPIAQRAEDIRDLRRKIEGLSQEDEAEFIFRDTSPQRRKVTVYSMLNGEPVQIPAYMLDNILTKKLDDGRDAFTAFPEKAPEFKLGTVKCFLHKNSAWRSVLEQIGLGGASCPAEHLASEYSGRIHGQHRHKQEWSTLQEHIQAEEKRLDRERQERQLEATMALARGATGQAHDVVECDKCDFRGTKKQVAGHRMGAHK